MYGIKVKLDEDTELWVLKHKEEQEPESFDTFEEAHNWAIKTGWINFKVEKLSCV